MLAQWCRWTAWVAAAITLTLAATPAGAFQILGTEVEEGERRLLWLDLTESFAAIPVRAPVHVVRGRQDGPVLCLFGGVHGDELNGIEIVRRLIDGAKPDSLRGTLVGAPIVNVLAFRLGSRYLPDRRDLNRFFPGDPSGSSAARIAHAVFDQVIRRCTHLVDYHTGSLRRSNVPQVRGDADDATVESMMRAFGLVGIVNKGRRGTLRRAATEAGIPSILFEGGEPSRFNEGYIEAGVDGTLRLMGALEMIDEAPAAAGPASLYRKSEWVRSGAGGVLLHAVEIGAMVVEGERLGTVHDPIEGKRTEILSPVTGQVVGLALPQLVMPGFGVFHVAYDPR